MNKISKIIHLCLQFLLAVFLVFLIVVGIKNGLSTVFLGLTYGKYIPLTILGYLILEFVWLLLDYYKHRKPLLAVDPEVDYSLIHHIKQVTIPIIEYRFSNIFKK